MSNTERRIAERRVEQIPGEPYRRMRIRRKCDQEAKLRDLAAPAVEASGTPRCDAVAAACMCNDDLAALFPELARTLERELAQTTEFASAWHHAVDTAATVIYLPTKLPNPTTFLTELRDHDDRLRSDLSRLTRELEEARKNERRYLWLRSKAKRNSPLSNNKRAGDIYVIQWIDRTEANTLRMEELDSAIDSRLSGGGGEG